MSIKQKAADALAALGAITGPQVLAVQDGPNSLSCELAALDSMACGFNRLSLETDSLSDLRIEDIQRVSEDLSQRLTYLLEPVAPIEINSEKCTVQMRSKPPQRDDDQSTYYELLVQKGGLIQLCRYRKRRGSARENIAAQVTREVWSRLVADFTAAAGVS